MTNPRPTSPAHTPAPWTIEDEGDKHSVRLELKGDSGSKPIAHLYSMSKAFDDDYDSQETLEDNLAEYDANARLIAAAPELLEAVEYVLELCKLDHMDWEALENNCVPMLEKAIAKARGESETIDG